MTNPPPADTLPALLAALRWQLDMGADEAIEEVATNWTTLKPAAKALPAEPPPAPPARTLYSSAPLPAAKPAAAPAPDLAKIETLADLKAALERLEGPSIKQTAMNMVFGEGALNPPVMFIGEAPGEEEDRTGRPFVGRAGQLLEKMLAAIGLSREQVYITNVINWRPPGNRTPKTEEVATCLPYLLRHIELVNPALIVCLGGPSASAILAKAETVTKLRGKWWEHTTPTMPTTRPVLVTYHPAYLLRTPLQKRESWRDLRLLTKKLPPVAGA